MKDDHILPFLWMRGEPEATIRREIAKINDCGISALCLEARPHKDFCGPGWWHDVDIVLDEARRRDMRVWILDDRHFPTGYANGLIETKYPERRKRYLNYTSAEIYGSAKPLELDIAGMLKPPTPYWELGKPADPERENNTLFSVTALRFADRGEAAGGPDAYATETVDLTADVRGGRLHFRLPEGAWRVVVVYRTRTDGGDPAYINLIDKTSAHTQIEGVYETHYSHYASEFGRTIAGFFSDEPQFGNMPGLGFGAVVGRCEMPMPWSDELEERLREKYGPSLESLLPFLWLDAEEGSVSAAFRFAYMDNVSKLYEQNFSRAIGDWCRAHGVSYIGHVVEDSGSHSRLGIGAAHYFRAMAGQDMAGIDCIGDQVVCGAPFEERRGMVRIDGEFCHYTLGVLGASAGHLDPAKKGRTMCELFGAYGWRFGVRDMKYVLDHLLSRGVNYLVPHAFSMAEYPDPDCPPHFYAGGNNPEYPYFQYLMRYADRMCRLLSGGVHVPVAAVLYDAEAEWAGDRMPMQKVIRELHTHQIDLDIASLDMLGRLKEHYGTHTESGAEEGRRDRLVIGGVSFRVLIVPRMQRMTSALAEFIAQEPDFPVLFTDALPEGVADAQNAKALPAAVTSCPVVPLTDLSVWIRKNGFADVAAETAEEAAAPESAGEYADAQDPADLTVYHYRKDRDLYLLLNESPSRRFSGRLTVSAAGRRSAEISLEPLECVVFQDSENGGLEKTDTGITVAEMPESTQNRIRLSGNWKVSRVRAIAYPDFPEEREIADLAPVSEEAPDFSGVIRYRKEFEMPAKPAEAVLVCENVFEVMKVRVNGQEAGMILQPPYRVRVDAFLTAGRNTLEIEVATTPDRDQQNYPAPPFVPEYTAQEPTGLWGDVELVWR